MTTITDDLPTGGVSDHPDVSRAPKPHRRYFFNPWVDFLGLGGGSVFVLGGMTAFYPKDDESLAVLATTMLIVAHFVNHPHFAHSYQLFYKDFVRKAFSPDSVLRRRYRFAGILVPAVLVTFFASALSQGSAPLMGLAANLMFFTVGWHYAKQGYGILMLDAVYKGTAFSTREKRHLLWNTHLSWLTFWLMTNNALAAKDYWGLTYYMFEVPDALLVAMFTLTGASAAVVARDLIFKWRFERTLPVNGLIAYVVSVYFWLMVGHHNPVIFLAVPMFHSLQYMFVVWRYQLNVEAGKLREQLVADGRGKLKPAWYRTAVAGLARFALVGGLLGVIGFWLAPMSIDAAAGYDRAVFGTTLFLFIGWTFINIHHYFIDSVIWRHENTEIRRHLSA